MGNIRRGLVEKDAAAIVGGPTLPGIQVALGIPPAIQLKITQRQPWPQIIPDRQQVPA